MASADSIQSARVLIIDDQEVSSRLLALILEREGFTNVLCIPDSRQAIAAFDVYQPDIVLLDLLMPGLDGFSLIELLRRRTSPEAFVPVLVLTADVSAEARRRALALGARDFLTRPFDPIEVMLRIWNLLETRMLYRQLQRRNQELGAEIERGVRELDTAQTELILRLSQAAEDREEGTGDHTQRVGRMAALIARALGVDEEQVELIRRAAPLHDIGKVAIPDQILLKPGRLSPEELATMREHVAVGARILGDSRLPLLQMAHEIVLTHHEHWDGSGYPRGLAGEQIPLAGRIVAVADAFDAISHVRPYRPARTIDEAAAEIRAGAGTRYDPAVVEAFMRVLAQEGPAPAARRLSYPSRTAVATHA
jgi:putative two-component system response regulator